GFETFAAELGVRLVTRGHRVSVYCRPFCAGEGPTWNGIERIVLPAMQHKYLETVSHTFLSAWDALGRELEVVLLCNAANSFVLQRLDVRPREYILYVSRFEPENNPLEVVLAYEKLSDGPPLLMVGEGLYAKDLVRELERHASNRIRFPGGIYGADYRTLQRNALLYVQATEVGETHPAMIEALAAGGLVRAHDTPE